MNQEFTVEEIKDIARVARIYCPGFSEEKFKSLMELERRIADSGFLESVQGLLRLEEEKGVFCTEALDTCEELLERKTKLEREVPELEKRVESLIAQIKQANIEYEQIRGQYAATEKKLEAFNKRMEREKQL